MVRNQSNNEAVVSQVQAHCGSKGAGTGETYKTPKMVPFNSNQFEAWLSGFLLAAGKNGLTAEQVEIIKNKLQEIRNYTWTYLPNDITWWNQTICSSDKTTYFC